MARAGPADRPDPRTARVRLGARDVWRPRPRSPPEPAQGAPPGRPASVTFDEMVAFKRAVVRELGDAATGVLLDPEIGAAQSIVDGSLPGRQRPARGRRGHRLRRARRRPGSAACSTAGAWPRRSGWGRRRPSSSSTTTRTRRTPPTRSASWRTSPPTASRPTCRCSSSRCRSRSTRPSRRLEGERRRRVVVETARRLTRLGGDVLKAEFPYDPGVTDEGRWRDACAELDEASRLPWVVLSGGVDDAVFEAQVRVACGAGASGVLVGRSVWAAAATLARAERDAFLRTTGRARLARLVDLVDELGRPWTERPGPLVPTPEPADGWYPRSTPGDRRAPVRPARGRRAQPGHPDRRPERDARLRPGRDDRRRDPAGDRLVVGDRRVRGGPARAADGLRRGRGEDPFGRFMLDALGDAGIDTSGCRIDPTVATGATVIISRGPDRANLTAIGAIDRLRAHDIPRELLAAARHVHVGQHLPPAGARRRPARPVCRGPGGRPDDLVRLQLGFDRDLGQRDRPAPPGGRRVPAEPRGGPSDHRSDGRSGRRIRAHPSGDRRPGGRPAVHPGRQARRRRCRGDARRVGVRGRRGRRRSRSTSSTRPARATRSMPGSCMAPSPAGRCAMPSSWEWRAAPCRCTGIGGTAAQPTLEQARAALAAAGR